MPETSGNRFIFSDDFYNNLENPTTETNQVIDNTLSSIEIPKFEQHVQNNNSFINEPFNNNVDNNNFIPDFINNNETSNEVKNDFNQIEELDNKVELNNNDFLLNTENNNIVNNDIPDLLSTTQEIESSQIDELDDVVDKYGIPISNNNDTNTFVEPVDSLNSDNNFNFNVESGIDTSLEEQLLKPQSEYTYKPDIINNNYFNEPQEKTVYRAIRRPRTTPIETPSYTNSNYNNQVNNYSENNLEKIASSLENERPFENKVSEEDLNWKPEIVEPVVIQEEINYYEEESKDIEIFKSDLLERLAEKERETGKISILARYGEDFCSRDYVTNPAIGRDNEIKELGLILITPEKSAILVGKPGIGKTSIVEGLAYRIQRNKVPDILKGYTIISIKTTSLLGTLPNGETRLQTLIDEIKELDKIILFIDEIHMLMGATHESGLDFANMFKESLGRGSIKMIGATTSDEYERYVLRDKAFVRRFQRVDVLEPTKEETVEILMGTLPKIEKTTNAKLKYTHYLQVEIMNFIVDITNEYKRVYGIGSRYPDICITLLNQAFSEAIFNNRREVNILDIRNAIANSKNIYPDVIKKELINFDDKFKQLIAEEKTTF